MKKAVTTLKMAFFILAAVRTRNLTKLHIDGFVSASSYHDDGIPMPVSQPTLKLKHPHVL
jgi:hypothetical protein